MTPLFNRRRWLLAGATTLVSPVRAQQRRPRIVASFSILADMLREIAPPGFDVSALVGPDADAHVFEPTPSDARRLAQADLAVVNGLGFEGWIDRLVQASGYRGTVVVASQDIKPRRDGQNDTDPHAWQDLTHAQRYVQTLAKALATRWPAAQSEVASRATDYLRRIAELDAQVRTWLAAVPRPQRRVVTSHDAFGYFGAAYGVDFLAPRGWSTASEPSAAAVARLVRQLREQRVRALFVENISDPRLIERVAKETGARVGGTLYSDALSAPGGPADTYLKLFEHNARTLASTLDS
ncbi:zinc ABC transporter substrate-binding protein [Schlegelella sp. S2-27]|uniref:Zinc ABC transporter substrate-binding protein n=1 Tax=Caldimonas mangrovi TaxID=2944811 RepID=A0ABT0YPI1_9BURK|nr:zinc ABC transporter substrate-binding protein [Caldimonas mangrovi]MCM5680647.1 zinc ABC transporter substrate-binding protein [Caldimonas mangrovi]